MIPNDSVSIHATLAGGDCLWSSHGLTTWRFYPRHPRGWRPIQGRCLRQWALVSIHATLAGGDFTPRAHYKAIIMFLSTPPSRVATTAQQRNSIITMFLSTPPSRVATVGDGQKISRNRRFYPRHPRGWRRREVSCSPNASMFLSTPPSRVATHVGAEYPAPYHVSIHATLAGGDGV